MTPDDANMLVAEFWNQGAGKGGRLLWGALAEFAERISERAVAGEREASAGAAEDIGHEELVAFDDGAAHTQDFYTGYDVGGAVAAKVIRARGETGKFAGVGE